MKNFLTTALVGIIAICLITSCKKEKTGPAPVPTKTLKFILYTNKDFSDDDHNISFALHITKTGGFIVLDSTVATMKIKDIPNKANQLVFEKKLPLDGSVLTAGFVYSIENVGVSWHLDTVASNEKFKVIEYPFE